MRKIFYGLTVSSVLATTIFGDVNLSNGLVAHYEFEGNANDSSGNENHGTEEGNLSYYQGMIGKAVRFNGNYSDFIRVNHNDILNISGNYSFALWIYNEPDAGGTRVAFTKGNHCENSYHFTRGVYFAVGYGDSWCHSEGISISSFNNYEWHSIVGIVENSNRKIKFYFDGQLEEETNITLNSTTTTKDLFIGRHNTDNSSSSRYAYPYIGQIDDFRIYNRALSEDEISELYRLGVGECPSQIIYGKNPKTGIWYPFSSLCEVPNNWETNLTQPTDFDSETLGIPPSVPIDENTTAIFNSIFNASFKAGVESVENSYSEQNWTSEKAENLSNGWTLNGTANDISDLTVFDSANIVWIFENGVWKAWSSDSAMKTLIESKAELFNEIPKDSGFWIFK
jgi:hypothetical protein